MIVRRRAFSELGGGDFHLFFLTLAAIGSIEWGTVCMGQALRAVFDASREAKADLTL